MRSDRFTIKAQEALREAQELAESFQHSELRPLHLLLALTRQEEGIVSPTLQRLGASPDAVAAAADKKLAQAPKVTGPSEVRLSGALNDVLKQAEKTLKEFGEFLFSFAHLYLYNLASLCLRV